MSDEDNQVALAYGAVSARDAKSHRRISYVIGSDGLIERVYEKVKAAEHPGQVLADLGG